MCSCAPHLFLAHALGLGLGIMVILELARRGTPARVFWFATAAMTITMAAMVFYVTRGHLFYDFTKAYWVAGEAALQSRSAIVDLYQSGIEGFVNIPILAYLFVPFALLTPMTAALALTALGLLAVYATWRLVSVAADLDLGERAVLALVAAAFGPLIYSIREGNTSHMVLLLVVVAFLLLRERREILAGALLGVAALIKLPLMLFGIYFALRGRWGAVVGGGAVVGAMALASLLVFGLEAHVTWFEQSVRPFANDPMPALNVQSIAGALARLELGGTSTLEWKPHQLSQPLQLMAKGSTVLLLALAAASVLAPRRATALTVSRDIALEVEFLIVLMLACIISPLSWSHYYAWMLMPIAFFLGQSPHFRRGIAVRVIGWLAIFLAAAPVTLLWFNNVLLQEVATRVGASGLLLGGLLMLGLLLWSRWQLRYAQEDVSAAAPGGGKMSQISA